LDNLPEATETRILSLHYVHNKAEEGKCNMKKKASGIFQKENANWIWAAILGLIYAVIYCFIFDTVLTKMSLKPHRQKAAKKGTHFHKKNKATKANTSKTTGHSHSDTISMLILEGIGGKDNLSDVDCCATRLRITVKDTSKINDEKLKATGALGIIHRGNSIQIIYGPHVLTIKSNLENFFEPIDSNSPNTMSAAKTIKTQKLEPTGKQASLVAEKLAAHMNGTVVSLEKVEDDIFSAKILGDGVAIEPEEGKLYAPCDGQVVTVFSTKHAVNIISKEGAEILLHIGIDTARLAGKYFRCHVRDGQDMKKGDLLISFNMDAIKAEGYKLTTPLIICNTEKYSTISTIAQGKICAGSDLAEAFRL